MGTLHKGDNDDNNNNNMDKIASNAWLKLENSSQKLLDL